MNNRRNFIKKTAALTMGASAMAGFSKPIFSRSAINQQIEGINIVGPKKGVYSRNWNLSLYDELDEKHHVATCIWNVTERSRLST